MGRGKSWNQPLSLMLNFNEQSSVDSLFQKGNAQLYLFTLDSTHFSFSSGKWVGKRGCPDRSGVYRQRISSS